jgi:hypothetical protein
MILKKCLLSFVNYFFFGNNYLCIGYIRVDVLIFLGEFPRAIKEQKV